jgi:hypothetical protein
VRSTRERVTRSAPGWAEWNLDCPDGWAHHGVAALDGDLVVAYHPGERALLFFSPDGRLERSASCEAVEAHDIVATPGGLWIADCGNKLRIDAAGTAEIVPPLERSVGSVLLVDLDGHTRRRIEAWHDGPFLPTGVAPEERGIWIADGYGSNRVDLVAPDGEVLVTIDGLDCPHGVRIDRRRDRPLLAIAERGAARVTVHDLDGGFVRHHGVGHLIAPCALATSGDHLYVADLAARVTVLDLEGELVTHLGADPDAMRRPGWPNDARQDGQVRVSHPTPGRFNSPHGIAVSGDDLVVTEWLLGGRWIRLRDVLDGA